MKTQVERRLFWYLKEGAELDLSNKAHLDMYVQQILSRGRAADVKRLLQTISPSDFVESFSRIKDFLPREIKIFWEEGLGNINESAKKDTDSLY